MKLRFLLFSFLIVSTAFGQNTADDYIRSGNQKEKVNDYKGALMDYQKAYEMDPANTEALYSTGYMKFLMQDYMSAITDFDNAIKSDTESVELFYARGNANFEMKNYSAAIIDYNHAIFLDSTDKESYYNRAIAKYNSGQRESACKDLLMAKKYGDPLAEETWKELCR